MDLHEYLYRELGSWSKVDEKIRQLEEQELEESIKNSESGK